MINDDIEITLIDFGYSVHNKKPNQQLYRCCGTPYYVPPEMIQQIGYTGKFLI